MKNPHSLRMALRWLIEAKEADKALDRLQCVRAAQRHVTALLRALEGKQ